MPTDSMFSDYDTEACYDPAFGTFVLFSPEEATPAESQRNPAFVVDSTAKAEWAMQRLAAARAEIAARAVESDELKARVEDWFQRVVRRPARAAEFMGRLLVAYHQRVWDEAIAAGVSERDLPKTVALPSGDLTSRAPGSGRLHVEDEAALIGWLEANGAPVEEVTTRQVRKSELRARCVEVEKDGETVLVFDGQVVPYVRIEKGEERSWGVKPHE